MKERLLFEGMRLAGEWSTPDGMQEGAMKGR